MLVASASTSTSKVSPFSGRQEIWRVETTDWQAQGVPQKVVKILQKHIPNWDIAPNGFEACRCQAQEGFEEKIQVTKGSAARRDAHLLSHRRKNTTWDGWELFLRGK